MLFRRGLFSLARFSRSFSSHSQPQSRNIPSREELFDNTSDRWLYNEKEQLALRHVEFNTEKLISAACAAVNAESCTLMTKIAEGSFNKIFRLNFNNGKSLIARIPSPRMSGRGLSWVTKSEAATLDLMAFLKARTPRLVAFSSDSTNPVGSPYLLLEDIEGVSLGEEWRENSTRGAPVVDLLQAMIRFFHLPTAPPYTQYGALYFATDFPSSLPLLNPRRFNPPHFEHKRPFSVGPIADMLWWRPYHDEPSLNRGPWDTPEEMLLSAVAMERRAVERHRQDISSLRYTRSSFDDLYQVEALLNKVEVLVPRLRDAFNDVNLRPAMMHPDMREDNVIVPRLNDHNAETRFKDPFLIDWQGTSILPLALQVHVPLIAQYTPTMFYADGRPIFSPPEPYFETGEVALPPEFPQMSFDEQEDVRAELRLVMRHIRWSEAICKGSTEWNFLLNHSLTPYLNNLLQAILRACADGPLSLRSLLANIELSWLPDLWGPCPYTFSEEEIGQFKLDMARYRLYKSNLNQLMARLNCEEDGRVSSENYEESLAELVLAKSEWNEKECGGPFPFEEGRWGMFLS